MPNFWGFIKKQKKALWLILLFFIAIGFAFPNTVTADVFGIDGVPGRILVWLADAWYWIFWTLAEVSYKVFHEIFKTIISTNLTTNQYSNFTWSITRNSVFLNSWNIVKDWANILIVLGIIGVALMMILRLWTDNAKRSLAGLIMVALLVNFSVVFCGLLIDASNVAMNFMKSDQKNIAGTINRIKDNISSNFTSVEDFYTQVIYMFHYIAILAVFDLMFIILTIVYAYFSVMMIQRYILLAILFILSPLAFALFVFPIPAAKKFWDEWWHNFIKWCFIGVGAMFFLNLSSRLLIIWHGNFKLETKNNNAAILITSMMPMLLQLLVITGVLFIGLRIAKKGGGPVADFTMGLAKKGIGIVAGATAAVMTKGAMAGLRATGIAGAAQTTKERAGDFGTRLGEKFGLVRRGTADLKRQERFQKQIKESESKERMDAIGSKARLDMAKKFTYNKYLDTSNPKKKEETAGLVKSLLENGDFAKLSPAKQKELIEFSKNVIPGTVPMKEFAKVNPDYVKYDTAAIDEEKRKLVGKESGKIDPATGVNIKYIPSDMNKPKSRLYTAMQEEAERRARRKAFAAMKVENLESMSPVDVAREAREKTAKGAQYLQEATKRNILEMVGTQSEVGDLLKHSKKEYGTNTLRNARKINPKYVQSDEEAISKQLTESSITPATATATQRNSAIKALRIADYKGLGPREIKDMEDDAFTLEFVDATSAKKITKADELGLSEKKREKLRLLLPTISSAIAVAAPGGTSPNSKRHKELTDKYKAIDVL